MSGRYFVAAAYIGTLMGSGAAISLLLASLMLSWFGVDQFRELIGAAIQVGAALCVISLGARLIVGTWVWFKTRTGQA